MIRTPGRYLFVLHDSPYGTERTYNGLRWASEVLSQNNAEVRIFLIGDAVVSLASDQKVPPGYYNIGGIVESVARHSGVIGGCGSCLDARGINEDRILKGAHRSSMAELGEWTAWADQVINV